MNMKCEGINTLAFHKEKNESKSIKILELFGGIGAIRKAFINAKIPYEVVDYVEIDKNCVKSYNALYGENYKPKDIRSYHAPNIKIDLLMHGSPCQDFSTVGKQKGGMIGTNTRSSLLFETIRIIKEMNYKPDTIIWENVKGVFNQKLKLAFFYYLEELKRLGYKNNYKILSSYDFGLPQKRERIFVVSMLDGSKFNFDKLKKSKPLPIKHILEKDVSNKYEVVQKSMLKYFENPKYKRIFKANIHIIKNYTFTVCTKQDRLPNAGFIPLNNGKYRYLTERECFRLMGFDDEDFNKLLKVYPISKKHKSYILYKQAGNSIAINVLVAIIEELYIKENKNA